MSANVNNLINNLNNRLLTVLNNITTTTSLAASYGMGKYLPLSYTAPLIFATNTQVLKKKVSGTNYIVFTYTFYFLDNIGGASSEVGLGDIFNNILLNYTDYLDLYSSSFPNPITILPLKGAKCEGVEFTYDLDKINLPQDSCCDIILIEGPAGTSGMTGSSGSSGVNGSSGATGEAGSSGSSGVNGTSGSSGKDGFSTGLIYFFNRSISSDVPTYYAMERNLIIGAGTTLSASGAGTQLIGEFVTDINDPNVTLIPSGNWNFENFVAMSSNGGTPGLYANIYIRNSVGVETLLGSNSSIPHSITEGTILEMYSFSVAVPTTSINATDRIVIKFYAVNLGGKTMTLHFEDNTIAQVLTTLAPFKSGSSGSSGTSGSSGSSGTNGATGAPGTSGSSGTNGATGAPGTSGSSGTSGLAGVSGSSGSSGTDGVAGAPGTSGSSGSSGTNGAPGTSGSSGSSGTNGATGAPGTSGSSGSSGVNGATGAPGTSGSSGSSGVNGAAGLPGTSGSSGTNGATGTPGVSGSSGSSGTNGLGVAGAAFGVTIDGSGEVPTTGSVGYVRVPYNCTINTWSMAANATGSAVVDVKRSGTSIVGTGNKPTLSSGQFALTAVSGWTSIAVAANDLIEFNLDSVATLTRLNLSIIVTRS